MGRGGGRTVLVCGATGRQGGAVARHLLRDGWHVRALTRTPTGAGGTTLARLGVEVVGADMGDPASLREPMRGVYGVYSVQNPMISGHDAEVAQGRHVADAALAAGVEHVAYGSAGVGIAGTGVGSWESKLEVRAYMEDLGLSLTVLRPVAFMELMSDRGYFPPVSTWHVMPRLMGGDRPVGWLAVDDLGAIAAEVFARPDEFVGRELPLAADIQTIDQCRQLHREVRGRAPRRFPLPVWMFRRFVGDDLVTMWRWLRSNTFELETETTRSVLPEALTVREWLSRGGAPRTSSSRAAAPHFVATDRPMPDQEEAMDHPNLERLRKFLVAHAGSDVEAIRAALATDAVWHVGGTHRLSGDLRGRDDICAYFSEVGRETGGSMQLEPLELMANDKHGAAFLRVVADRDDRHLDVVMAEAFEFDASGRIKQFWAHATDQDAIDAFWA